MGGEQPARPATRPCHWMSAKEYSYAAESGAGRASTTIMPQIPSNR